MREGHHKLTYRPMPAQSRFGLFGWPLHRENCYLQTELQFRQRILTARAASGLDQELLQTSDSWFSENNDVAFINENENAWFLNNEYRPRHELSLDDFHISLIESQRLNWPGLSTLMRHIGDYLLIRNSQLSAEYFNQPMNYVLLDVAQMLKRLAVIENPTYVAQQLQLLRHYLRAIEIHIPPTYGSDRLFLADCRYGIEMNVEAEIIHTLLTQQLKKRLYSVKQQLNKVAELRHTILHFALAKDPVNPHPYWEQFKNDEQALDAKAAFPTLAAKACAMVSNDAITDFAIQPTLLPVTLDEQMLENCPDFKLIHSLPASVKTAYGQSITDLQEIVRFQTILDRLLQVFDQAGEVFTLLQFREEMQHLLQSIEQFIQHSEKNILLILDANTRAYHQFIQDKQDLTWWDKVVKKRQTTIDNFILNQDNLARFATSPSDLHQASNELLEQVNQVVNHLNQHSNYNDQLQLVTNVKQLTEQLMDSMHAWVNQQRIVQGLPVMPKSIAPVEEKLIEAKDTLPSAKRVNVEKVKKPARTAHAHNSLFKPAKHPKPQPLSQQILPLTLNSTPQMCPAPIRPYRPLISSNEPTTPVIASQNDNTVIWIAGFILLLPTCFLVIKIIYDKLHQQENETNEEEVNKEDFTLSLAHAADKLSVATHAALTAPTDWQGHIELYDDELQTLQAKLKPTKHDLNALQELTKDIDYLIKSIIKDRSCLESIPLSNRKGQ
ncbi:Uncharacterised protein [Legionella beliardensis]|uniref:Uncharacterized protein n=1 Tax=Legionella beliardensis TaxID=91822 RepID=A0A378HX61_9GAMM|nr:hypothetical protein [Legionella beliardensis]STX27508.1 Uncharacterised protein [Legionella beliardensis]